MNRLRKIVIIPLVLVLCIVGLTACQGKKDSAQTSGESIEGTNSTESDYSASKIVAAISLVKWDTDITLAANINPLTGLNDISYEAVGKRPVAIMVNNIEASFPQYGIEKADIIFEIPVEGKQTRFMAMYADYTQIPNVCSIRSARKYFPAISEGFDAIYVNWGRNEVIIPYLESLNLTQYEGLYNEGNLFARDAERRNAGYSLEHTGYFKGPELPAVLAKDNARVEIEEDKKGLAFNFCAYGEKIVPEGTTCTEVNVDFGVALATFRYDEITNAYYKEYNGKAQIDGSTGNQLSFTNVFVLETKITADANGLHRDVDWSGGDGYYVSNGVVQKIKWSKASEQEPLLLYDENGNQLTINRGKSYFGINYIGEATFQ